MQDQEFGRGPRDTPSPAGEAGVGTSLQEPSGSAGSSGPRWDRNFGCRVAWWVLFLILMVPCAESSVVCNGSFVVVPTIDLRSSAGSVSCPCVLVLLLLLFYMITCCI